MTSSMNESDSALVREAFCLAAGAALDTERERYQDATDAREPCNVYRPRLFIDGDKWCALYGENLQDGVAGFGDSPELAYADFNRAWAEKLPGKP